MIPQLVDRLIGEGLTPAHAVARVLGADPIDLVMYLDRVWAAAHPGEPQSLRQQLMDLSAFGDHAFPATGPLPASVRSWHHVGFSFCIDNTRAAQILVRVVRAYRSGEALGVPSVETQRWLDNTEVLLSGAANPFGAWLSTSAVRPDAEGVRRNAYWRILGMDLAFGDESNAPVGYHKAESANREFTQVFEELLTELSRAIESDAPDDERIFRLSEGLGSMLRARRREHFLDREELAAATVTGWLDLTLAANTSLVTDLRATATSPAERLRLIGDRVGLAPHSRAAAFFSMATDLSVLLRVLEGGEIAGPEQAPLFYEESRPAIGIEARRVIAGWQAASQS